MARNSNGDTPIVVPTLPPVQRFFIATPLIVRNRILIPLIGPPHQARTCLAKPIWRLSLDDLRVLGRTTLHTLTPSVRSPRGTLGALEKHVLLHAFQSLQVPRQNPQTASPPHGPQPWNQRRTTIVLRADRQGGRLFRRTPPSVARMRQLFAFDLQVSLVTSHHDPHDGGNDR